MSKGSGQTAHQWKRWQWIYARSLTPIKQTKNSKRLNKKRIKCLGYLLTDNYSGDTLLITFINTQNLPKCRRGGGKLTFHTT